MTRIQVPSLRLIRQLANLFQVARSQEEGKSTKSIHHLSYNGGEFVTFVTGDDRTYLKSRVPVCGEGHEQHWERTIEARAFQKPFDLLEQGGSYVLDVSSAHLIKLQKQANILIYGRPFAPDHDKAIFQYPIPCVRVPIRVSPLDESAEDLEWHDIDLEKTYRLLGLVKNTNDLKSRELAKDTVSMMANGKVFRRQQQTNIRVGGMPVPIPIHLYTRDARRLYLWLRLMKERVVRQSEAEPGTNSTFRMGSVAVISDHGRSYYIFRTPDKNNYIRIIKSENEYPSAYLCQLDDAKVGLEFTVFKEKLVPRVKWCNQFRSSKIALTWDPSQPNALQMDLIYSGSSGEETPLAYDVIPIESHHSENVGKLTFAVSAKELARSMIQGRNKSIVLRVYLAQHVMKITCQTAAIVEDSLEVENFIRTKLISWVEEDGGDYDADIQPD